MIGLLCDLGHYMDSNINKGLLDKDRNFIKNVYENIPIE
jgi:hypothetical protein